MVGDHDQTPTQLVGGRECIHVIKHTGQQCITEFTFLRENTAVSHSQREMVNVPLTRFTRAYRPKHLDLH